jgi:hypothetical protein
MVNGPVVADAIKDPNNRLPALLRKEKDSARVVEELYLAMLCRKPTPKELAAGLKALKDGEDDFGEMVAEAKKRQAALAAYLQTIPTRMTAWEAGLQRRPEWQPVEIVKMTAKSGATLTKQADGSILVSGKMAPREVYTIKATTPLVGITAFRLEVLPDKSLPASGPGRAANGNFVLNELQLSAVEIGKQDKPARIGLHRAAATFSQASFEVGKAIDNNPATGWAVAPMFGKGQTAKFELVAPLNYPKGAQLTFALVQNFGTNHTIGKLRLSVTTTKPPLSLTGPPAHLAAILAVLPAQRTPQQKAALEAAYRAGDAELARLQGEVSRTAMPVDRRHPGAQDLMWALINSKAFQFNH